MKLNEKALLAAALGLALAGPSFSQAADAAQDDSSALFDQAAAAPAASGDAAPAETTFALGLSGSHEFGYRLPAYDEDSFGYASEMKSPYFDSELGLTVQDKDIKLVSNWDLALRPLAAVAASTDSATGEYGSWDKLVRARPLENYVSWSPSGWKLSAGYQVFSWGLADKRNPTDNLNPRDYTVGVNADKIPVLAADAVWYPTDSLSIEAVFAPTAQESKYPVDFKAEIEGNAKKIGIAAATAAAHAGIALSPTGSVSYAPLALEPKNAIAGGKASFRSSAFDASVSYLYDIDPLYTPKVTASAAMTGAASAAVSSTIVLERERIHRFGLDAKTTLGKFGLWTEAAYNLTGNEGDSDYSCRKSDLNYVLGTDVSFGPNDTMYCNLQYIGDWIPGFDGSFSKDYANGLPDLTKSITVPGYLQEYYQRATVNKLGLQTEGLLQGATLNLKLELADGAFTPQLTGAYVMPFLYDDALETRYGSLALNPEIDVKPVDSFHVKLGADLAYAWVKPAGGEVRLDTANDKVGVYTSSNNVYLQILYKWSYDLKK
jgi:hypothetical protein